MIDWILIGFGISICSLYYVFYKISKHCQSNVLLIENNINEKTFTRLKTLTECFDGFKLAEVDLKLRGSGNMSGTRQSGLFNNFRIANFNDVELIAETKKAADSISTNDPQLINYPEIKEAAKEIHPE